MTTITENRYTFEKKSLIDKTSTSKAIALEMVMDHIRKTQQKDNSFETSAEMLSH